MPRRTTARDALPPRILAALATLGSDLKYARKRRGWSLREAAKRLFVTVTTLRRLESGHSGVSLGVLAQAMFLYGLAERLEWLANPAFDAKALGAERRGRVGATEPDFDV